MVYGTGRKCKKTWAQKTERGKWKCRILKLWSGIISYVNDGNLKKLPRIITKNTKKGIIKWPGEEVI